MRLPRQKPEGPSVFHCRSHLVPEVPYLIPLEKHSFTRRFRRLHDLNAVRAGKVGDPKAYRFCGYGETLGGGAVARAGLGAFLPRGTWRERLAEYRKYLYVTGGQPGQRGKAVLKPEEIAQVIAKGGKVSVAEVLRLRVRYFTAGVVLGSQEFVERFWRERIKRPGSKRKTGARKMKWGGVGGDEDAAGPAEGCDRVKA